MLAEGRLPAQDPAHLPDGQPWCVSEVFVHAMHAVEIGQSGHKVGGRRHRLAVTLCRVVAVAVAARGCSRTISRFAESPSDEGDKYADLIPTLAIVRDVIVLSCRRGTRL